MPNFSRTELNAARLIGRNLIPQQHRVWKLPSWSAFTATPGRRVRTGSTPTIAQVEQVEQRLMLAGTAPVAEDVSIVATIGTFRTGVVPATDIDGEPLTFSLLSGPSQGSVNVNSSGSFSYTPLLTATGTDTFVVEVTDGDLTDTALVTVTMNNVPVTNSFTMNARQGELLAIQLPGFDPDGNLLGWNLIPSAQVGDIVSFDNEAGFYEYQLPSDFVGVDLFPFNIIDEYSTSQPEILTIVVAPNTAPAMSDTTFSIDENSLPGQAVGTVAATDAESDPLTYAIVGGNAGGDFTIDASTGAIAVSGTANLDFETTSAYQLQVEASDGILATAATVDIAINDLNEAPTELDVDIDLISLLGGSRFNTRYERFAALVIKGSDSLDVSNVNLDTLGFGVTGGEDSLVSRNGQAIGFISDINRDGEDDLVLLIKLSDLDAELGWNTLTVTGELNDGTTITGSTNERFVRSRRWWL